ncbi:hypothetical protein PVAG01_11077 [Phlyctema vagabunda]|uniref:Heterokaryon incompatibility domain-containing protein n=1 Tax=Phlyctema vagabunda TaxID=108571 RepID=A0ABR4P416_9HELO
MERSTAPTNINDVNNCADLIENVRLTCICEVCTHALAVLIDFDKAPKAYRSSGQVPHHQTRASLKASIDSGCRLCQWISIGLAEHKRIGKMRFSPGFMGGGGDRSPYYGPQFPLVIQPQLEDVDTSVATIRLGFASFGIRGTCHVDKKGSDNWLHSHNLRCYCDEAPSMIGLSIDSDHFDLSLAAQWLSQCTSRHPGQCELGARTELPTRLVEIRYVDGVLQPRLRYTSLISNETPISYVTLSHCWGDPSLDRSWRTTSLNLDSRMLHLPIETLPKTFRDTVVVAEALKIPYIWIDCLCIIQDSNEDWEKECAKMDAVYANAAVTVAALTARHPNDGFLVKTRTHLQMEDSTSARLGSEPSLDSDREASPFEPFEVQVQGDNSSSISRVQIEPPSTLPISGERGPLLRRGWALQEQLLSPRILKFKDDKMSYECVTARCTEGLRWPITDPKTLTKENREMLSQSHDPFDTIAKNILSFELPRHILWRDIVLEYTRRNLSFHSDMLPALSGIAKRFQRRFQDKYLAGLWVGDIIFSLGWHLDGDHMKLPTRGQRKSHPSWSWSSVFGPIELVGSWGYESERENLRLLASLQDADITTVGANNYGEISQATLTISGFLKRCSPEIYRGDRGRQGLELSFFNNEDSDDNGQTQNAQGEMEFSLDDLSDVEYLLSDNDFAISEDEWGRGGWSVKRQAVDVWILPLFIDKDLKNLQALVLLPIRYPIVGSDTSYRRIGLIRTPLRYGSNIDEWGYLKLELQHRGRLLDWLQEDKHSIELKLL